MLSDPITPLVEMSVQLHEMFTTFIKAGFKRDEALQLVITMMALNARPPL